MPALTFSVVGENAKFLIATASPVTGASTAPVFGELMGMLMLGIGEATPEAALAVCPGAEAPGIPATCRWPGPAVMAPAAVECGDWPHALRSPRAAAATVASPAATRDRRPT
ncbi:hypothetical protein GCM10010339_76380 [Streptomyces alanosinicus]|uniref:Uncharacterized protein n=1 Tax=Streptomyces alanosinicus TaxID=68171 RepID=A0A918YR11_9ACTN|nr:hypothetical protein GCM10010339_76380 [Streptomyces alanosinicus]